MPKLLREACPAPCRVSSLEAVPVIRSQEKLQKLQNDGVAEVGRDLCRSSATNPLLKQSQLEFTSIFRLITKLILVSFGSTKCTITHLQNQVLKNSVLCPMQFVVIFGKEDGIAGGSGEGEEKN